jgi:hypothetical protein
VLPTLLVVLIEPEVAVEVAPDDVLMVGTVLGVVVLDQERRALNPVVVTGALRFLRGANPREANLLGAGGFDLREPCRRQIGRLRGRVRFDE